MEHRPSSTPSDGSTFATKKLLDVVSSQLLDEKEYTDTNEDDLDLFLKAPNTADGNELRAASTSSTLSRPRSMPLQTIAKSEKILKKNVPLLKKGTQVQFSRADIENIHDKDILSFLQEHSQLFSKYLKDNAVSGRLNNVGATGEDGSKTTTQEVTDKINNLQKEIDFFITAVDQEGNNYRIDLDEEGNVVVPVEEDDFTLEEEGDNALLIESDADMEEEEEVEKNDTGDANDSVHDDDEEEETNYDISKNPKVVRGARFPRQTQNKETKRATTGKTEAAVKGKKKAKKPPLGESASSATVKDPRTLTVEEDERVAALLTEDFNGESGESATAKNPFVLDAATVDRLRQLDTALQRLRYIRGVQEKEEDPASDADEEGGDTTGTTTTTEDTAASRHAKGTAQMREAFKEAKRERKLNRINERLLKLQEEMEQLTLFSSSDTAEEDALHALRPEWAQAMPMIDEDEIQKLLVVAAQEEARAAEGGVAAETTKESDAESYFMTNMKSNLTSAVRLLEESEQNPITRKEWSEEEIRQKLIETYGEDFFEDPPPAEVKDAATS
ncbi:kinectin [Angomonas deanei]|nr:kinectin [Angomonas deanei]|eukprot:EPY18066.1 kinectin [Angomonas deanei]